MLKYTHQCKEFEHLHVQSIDYTRGKIMITLHYSSTDELVINFVDEECVHDVTVLSYVCLVKDSLSLYYTIPLGTC